MKHSRWMRWIAFGMAGMIAFLGLCAAAEEPSSPFAALNDGEVSRAYALGLLPPEWDASPEAPVTERQMYQLLANAALLEKGECTPPLANALNAATDKPLTRECAAVCLYQAALWLRQQVETPLETLWWLFDRQEPEGNGNLSDYWDIERALNSVSVEARHTDLIPYNGDADDCCAEKRSWLNAMPENPESEDADWSACARYFENGSDLCAVEYCIYQLSPVSGLPLMERADERAFRPQEPMTALEAVHGALRFYESNPSNLVKDEPKAETTHAETPATSEAEQQALCKEIIARADARREAILTSATEIAVSGASYYVSAEGDDQNDGLSPETPWKTVARVNEEELSPGDGVFFRRGDLWRGDMICRYQEGITYSAYGQGAKPAFYGSPENGSGAEKWTLLEGTDNIWVYSKEMPFLGSIVMNDGQAIATQHLSYWNGTEYTEYGTEDVPVDIRGMKDMHYFSAIDLTAWQENPDHHAVNGDLTVYDCAETGTLYLRCDAGNPGQVFDSIEFGAGWGHTVGGGCVVDNLCVKYVGNCGVMSDPGNPRGMTAQNCEIGFMGDIYLSFEQSDCHGVPGGEGFGFNGYGSVCKNNYVHDGRDGSFTIELGWDATIQEGQHRMGGMTAQGNLFQRSNGGIGIVNFLEEDAPIQITDILIDDNMFMYTGYRNVLDNGVEENVSCLHVWFAGGWDDLTGVTVSNNVFFLASPKLINLLNIGNAELNFQGNTYVQGTYQRAFTHCRSYGEEKNYGAADEAAFAAAVKDVLGDQSARVCTVTLGLQDAEINRAYQLGLVPEGALQNPDAQMTSAEMTELLTRFVTYRDAARLPAWEALSAQATQADAPLLRSDGMLALYEATAVLGMNGYRQDEAWDRFQLIQDALGDAWVEIDGACFDLYPNAMEKGIDPENPDFCLYHLSLLYALGRYSLASNAPVFDFDAANGTLHGNEPMTWRMAVQAVIRTLDAEIPDADKAYLVRIEP